MDFTFATLLASSGLFLGMLLLFEAGRRIGKARLARDPDGAAKGSGPVEAAVYGLLGLLLAFSFSGAASRFEERRHLIAEEANAIGTAWLRIDLLPAPGQPPMRQLFTRYLNQRLQTYRMPDDPALDGSASLQNDIWKQAVAASVQPGVPTQVSMLLLPALNDMFDVTTMRTVATENHPPAVVFLLLVGLSLVSSLVGGYVMAGSTVRNWFHMLLIATTMSLTLYVILDLEYPRQGLIRIDDADRPLIELQALMRRGPAS